MEASEEISQYEQLVQENIKNVGTVSKNDFDMISVLGQGSYGKVLLVQKKDNGNLYAMKILKKSEIIRRNQFEHTMTERRILEKVKHPFITQMFYAF